MLEPRPSYATARERFLAAANTAGAGHVAAYRNGHVGPGGEMLFVDVVRMGKSCARHTLVLVCGTHGVEGHCGSLIQSRLLETRRFSDLPTNVSVLLVHALNPYGFAWDRRVNEDGVDLNRNFIDFTKPLPANLKFDEELASLLAPDPCRRHEADVKLAAWFERQGDDARATIAAGQHDHPTAPFFGGLAPAWSRTVFERIVADHMKDAKRICLIDYHTGLGKFGRGQLIGATHASHAIHDLGSKVWGSTYVPAGDDGSVAYDFAGDLIGETANILRGTEVLSAAHEFGTLNERDVLKALRDDHGAHLRSCHGATGEVRDAMLKAFFCTDPAWTSAVEAEAVRAVAQALRWLAA